VGKLLAERAKSMGISKVAFDRGAFCIMVESKSWLKVVGNMAWILATEIFKLIY
jgi:hypothetical protein